MHFIIIKLFSGCFWIVMLWRILISWREIVVLQLVWLQVLYRGMLKKQKGLAPVSGLWYLDCIDIQGPAQAIYGMLLNCFATPTALECVDLGMSIKPLSTSPNKHIQKHQRENKDAEKRPAMGKKVTRSTLNEIVMFLLILGAFWLSLILLYGF